jgi:hypothetical protein
MPTGIPARSLKAATDCLVVVLRLADADVDDDLGDPGDLHHVAVVELLHQGRHDLLLVLLVEHRHLVALAVRLPLRGRGAGGGLLLGLDGLASRLVGLHLLGVRLLLFAHRPYWTSTFLIRS